jgi:hypothetical protein
MNWFIFQLGVLFLLTLAAAQSSPTPSEPQQPKPVVNISLGRVSIREDDCIPVEVWFANESGQEIKGAVLEISSPDFLRWSLEPCKVDIQVPIQSVSLEPVFTAHPVSRSILYRRLYLKTGTDIEVGENNLLFTIKYQWHAGGEVKQSFLASEKSIKVNLLGSDNVAGVPLVLAGLIVPGLFFWIVARWLGFSWATEMPLGDKLVYSVVVSIIFIALASALMSRVPWFHYLDISSGISIRKLIGLAGTGAAVGAFVSLIDYLRRRRSAKRTARTEVSFSDTPEAMVGKLLRKISTYNPSKPARLLSRISPTQFSGYKPQTMVKLKNGEIYSGSLGEKGTDLTVLTGWFKVTQDQAKLEAEELEALKTKGWLFDLFALAENKGFQIAGRNQVKQLVDGKIKPTGSFALVWPSSEVLQVVREPYRNEDEPLTLGSP